MKRYKEMTSHPSSLVTIWQW